jgi:Flp pilus assembly protein TadB
VTSARAQPIWLWVIAAIIGLALATIVDAGTLATIGLVAGVGIVLGLGFAAWQARQRPSP